MRRGRRIILADLRGMGQAASRSSSSRTDSPLGSEVKEAFLSLHIGRPLLGQRVSDLLVLLESLKSRQDSPYPSGFELVATFENTTLPWARADVVDGRRLSGEELRWSTLRALRVVSWWG